MSIKTELRLIETQQLGLLNVNFSHDVGNWNGTGTTEWTMSDWENSARSTINDETMLSQTPGTYITTGITYKLDYQIVRNSGETITTYFAGSSGSTRYEQGKYTEYFRVDYLSNTGLTMSGLTIIYINDALDPIPEPEQIIGFIPSKGFDGGITDVIVTEYDYDEYGIQLYDDLAYNLNFKLFDLDNLDDRSVTYSKTIKIPGTSYNNRILNHLYDIDVDCDMDTDVFFNKRIDCELLYDSIPIKEGFFELQRLNYNESLRQIEYEGVFYSKGKTFAENVGDKLMIGNLDISLDLDFTVYDHDLYITGVTASQDPTSDSYVNATGYYYPIIDYLNHQNNWWRIEDLRPSLYVKEIIDKIFADAGFSYESTFFNTDFFKSLILPWVEEIALDEEDLELRNAYVSFSEYSGDTYFTGYDSYLWAPTAGWYNWRDFYSDSKYSSYPLTSKEKRIPFNQDTPDPYYNSSGNDWDTTTFEYVCPARGEYDLQYTPSYRLFAQQLDVVNFGPNFLDALEHTGDKKVYWWFKLWCDPSDGGDPYLLTTTEKTLYVESHSGGDAFFPGGNQPNGDPYTENVNFTGTFHKGDKIYATMEISDPNTWVIAASGFVKIMRWWGMIEDSSVVKVIANPGFSLYEGERVEMKRCLPSGVKQMDFFKNIAKMFNLIIDEHPTMDNTLIIEPRDDYYKGGTTIDWSDKEDIQNSYEVSRIETLIDKDISFSYDEDTDTYNDEYTTTLEVNRIYGDHKVKNPYTSSSEYKIENMFSPTPLGNLVDTNWVTSKIFEIDDRDEIVERTFNPRILQRNSIPYGVSGLMPPGLSTFYVTSLNGVAVYGASTIPYQPYAGHLDNPYYPTKDLNYYINGSYMYNVSFYNGDDLVMTENNLYQDYWANYIAELMDVNSKKVIKKIKLSIDDIYTLNFANLIRIDGVVYTLSSINDWNPGEITEVELLKLSKYDLNNEVPPYISNMKGRSKSPRNDKVNNVIDLNIQPSIALDIWSGNTSYVSGVGLTSTGVTSSGATWIEGFYSGYTGNYNTYDKSVAGLVIGGNNILNNRDFLVRGSNNLIESSTHNITILSDNNTVEEGSSNVFISGSDNYIYSGVTNALIYSDDITVPYDIHDILVLGDYSPSGLTTEESNKVYLPLDYEISNHLSTTEIYNNFYDTGQTYTQAEIDQKITDAGGGTDGTDGSSGTSGIDGVDGTSGTDGADGKIGANGVDGTSGTDGQDGTNFGTSGTDGQDGTSGTSPVFTGITTTDQIDFIFSISGQTGFDFDLSRYAYYQYTVLEIHAETTSGSTIVDLRIDDVDISGMTNMSFNATESSYKSIGNDTVTTGQTLSLNVNSETSCEYLMGSIKIERSIEAGSSGTDGVSGTDGTSGINGTSGTDGIDGTNFGTSGTDGTSGTSGIDVSGSSIDILGIQVFL